jgi:signal transduction histidine kinase
MDLADDVQRLVDVIRRNVLLEVRLIDDLLDLTRIARGKLEMKRADIDLHALILDVSSMCQTDVLGKGLILVLDLSAPQHIVHADAARIQQVIWNLVKNAVKFTPRGGRIEVVTTNPEPGILRVVVSDTGVGIEEHLLAQIFDAFNQGAESTNRQYGGMGLGLAISKNIIVAHYGELTAASDGKGTGATFTIEMATTQSPLSAG